MTSLLYLRVIATGTIKKPFEFTPFIHTIGKMSASAAKTEKKKPQWTEEKTKYLNMSKEEKRKEYKCREDFHQLSDIKTWKEYVYEKKTLATKENMLPGCQINSNLNEMLSDKISIFLGDITTLEIDAIVNAANRSLAGGGGVDGAIHRAAGPFLLAENKTLLGCEVGEAKCTGGYRLPAKYVIAAVGPQGEKPDKLRSCYKNSLSIMLEKQLKTIAFPCISTGIYGYPLRPAAHVAIMETRKVLEAHSDAIDRVIFCLFSELDEEVYESLLQTYFPL